MTVTEYHRWVPIGPLSDIMHLIHLMCKPKSENVIRVLNLGMDMSYNTKV